MTENLLDFIDEDQQLKRRRRLRRITYNLCYFLIALCVINGVLVFTLLPDAVVIGGSLFAGWKARYAVSITVLLLLPAAAFLVTLLLAFIPVRATTYSQRGGIIFLLLMLAIEGACLFQIFTV